MRLDRATLSTHYKPVTFHDPEETVLLPDLSTHGDSFRTDADQQTFANYRRFMTGARVVKEPEP